MVENQVPNDAIIDPKQEVVDDVPVVANKVATAAEAPVIPEAPEKEMTPEDQAGLLIRKILIDGWRPSSINDLTVRETAQNMVNALAALDQMDQEIPDSAHPDKKIPNPSYKPGANYDASGKYVCIGPNGARIEGVAGMQTSIDTLRAIAGAEGVDQARKTKAGELAETLEKQLAAQKPAAEKATGPVKTNEAASREIEVLFGEGMGIDKARESEFKALWNSFNEGKIKGEELVKRAKEMTNNPTGNTEIALEKARRILAAKKLYHLFFPTRPIPKTENPDVLLSAVLENMGNPTTADAIKNRLGETLDLLRGIRGQGVLQLLMVLGSLMSSFANTATEAAK